MLSVDGSSNMNGSGIGLVFTSHEGDLIQQAIHYGFRAMNNEAKHKALIFWLKFTKDKGIKKLDIRSDFQLVVNQLLWPYQARDSKMTSYLAHEDLRSSTSPKFQDLRIAMLMHLCCVKTCVL